MEDIITRRFLLRELTMSDADDVYAILSDEKNRRYLNLPAVRERADAEKIVAHYLQKHREGKHYPFGIIERETGVFVGVFVFKFDLYDEDCFEFTVYLKSDYQGKGIATEIYPYMIKFAFDVIGPGCLRGFVMAGNTRSGKLLRRFGFTHERTFKVEGLPGLINSYLLTREAYANFSPLQCPSAV